MCFNMVHNNFQNIHLQCHFVLMYNIWKVSLNSFLCPLRTEMQFYSIISKQRTTHKFMLSGITSGTKEKPCKCHDMVSPCALFGNNMVNEMIC